MTCLFFGAAPIYAQRYVEIIAEIEAITYAPGNTNNTSVIARKKIPVACIAGTHEWRIDNYMEGGEQKCLFDGTNVYLGMRTLASGTKQTGGNNTRIQIAPFDTTTSKRPGVKVHPSADGRPWGGVEVAIPWLAFCSGTYLKSEGRIIPPPVYPILDAPARYGYSDRTETFDDALGLPLVVDLFTSAALYESSVMNWCRDYFLDVGKAKTKSGLQDGLLKFHYIVTESTNFQGWNFPLKFEYLEYASGAGGMLVPVFGGDGKVTSIRDGTKPQNPCISGMEHIVEDWRFRDSNKVNAIIYTSTNVSFKPTNDPALQKIFARAIAQGLSQPAKSHRQAKWVIIGAMVLSAVLLTMTSLKRSRMEKRKP